MPTKKLRKLLDLHQVNYKVLNHYLAYTAQEIAQLSHISGKEIAKTVIMKLDGKLTMVVVPASKFVDFEYLMEATGSRKVELVSEEKFKVLFPDCEVGAMPPFGHLYGIRVIMDDQLIRDKEIAFNAGNHRELIKMPLDDYLRLAQPDIMEVTSPYTEIESV